MNIINNYETYFQEIIKFISCVFNNKGLFDFLNILSYYLIKIFILLFHYQIRHFQIGIILIEINSFRTYYYILFKCL